MKDSGTEGKFVDILGQRVSEDELRAALQDVLKTRRLAGSLIVQGKEMTKEEKRAVMEGDQAYGNVYKYAFFD